MKMKAPKSWLALVAGIGGTVLFSTIAVGFADCLKETNTCTKDPCWGLWVRCTYNGISAPVVVVFNAASSPLNTRPRFGADGYVVRQRLEHRVLLSD